ncbi:MAG: amino acid permease [Hymenobacter sp.]
MAGSVVLLLVVLLYRRIEDIGKLGVALWVAVLGLMGWLIFGGFTHANHPVAWLPAGGREVAGPAYFGGDGPGGGQNHLFLPGLLQRVPPGSRDCAARKVIPRSIFLSILGITALYLLLNWSVGTVIPWEEVQGWRGRRGRLSHSSLSACLWSGFTGRRRPLVATGLVLLVAFASLFAVLLGYSRIPYAAAADGEFLPIFGKLHPTKQFPYVSLLLLGG